MRTAIVTVLLLTAAACAASPAADAGAATGTQASPTSAALVGTLGGDSALEGGCVWLDTDAGRVEVVWPDGYTASAEPLELRGPDGEVVAAAGDDVRIEGRRADDRVSVCQVGAIWEATAADAG